MQPAAGRRWRALPPLPQRKRITITLQLRGGAECWVEGVARGSMGRWTGHTPIYDVLEEIRKGAAFFSDVG